jgi:hypothetical protein
MSYSTDFTEVLTFKNMLNAVQDVDTSKIIQCPGCGLDFIPGEN